MEAGMAMRDIVESLSWRRRDCLGRFVRVSGLAEYRSSLELDLPEIGRRGCAGGWLIQRGCVMPGRVASWTVSASGTSPRNDRRPPADALGVCRCRGTRDKHWTQ